MDEQTTEFMPEAALGVSDEDFMSMSFDQFSNPDNVGSDASDEATGFMADGEMDAATEQTLDSGESLDDEATAELNDSDDEDAALDNVEDAGEHGEETEALNTEELDYQAQYQALLAPFKANGKEMQVDNVEDARRLMQMGANYNKKMAGLKPNLKILKMLDNHGLLSEEKLSYLIDLDKKNPDAINKLINDSGIDPLDITTDSDTEYKPGTYTVDDSSLALDEVLEEIQDTPSYNETIEIVGNKWDEASKRVLVENPDLIRLINSHVGNGIHAKVTAAMEKERMFGRLSGMSDLEAYKRVGDQLHAQGKLGQANPAPAAQKPAQKPSRDAALKQRKRAASSTAAKPKAAAPADFNPLNVSDEEFEKMLSSKYR